MDKFKYQHSEKEEKERKVPLWLKIVYVVTFVWAGIYLALYLRP